MQVVVILLIALVYLAEDASTWPPESWRLGESLTLMQRWLASLAPFAALAASATLAWMLCRRSMDRRGSWKAVFVADRLLSVAVWCVLAIQAFNVVVLDWVGAVRAAVGDVVLLDELIALTPPLLTVAAAWWGYYPVHRRLREASLIRQLDAGAPVYPIWTRGQYVLAQARLHLALLAVPALLLMGWSEAVNRFWSDEASAAGRDGAELEDALRGLVLFGGAVGLFLFAPLLMRVLWDTTPLAPGELRDRLERLCAAHGVRVRQLLVWNTNGGMINGAVMGLVGPLRYILLTDALLDAMTTRQVEAVMAHELGHVRRHHLPWLAIALTALFSVASIGASLVVMGIDSALRPPEPTPQERLAAELAAAWRRFASPSEDEATRRERERSLAPAYDDDWMEPAAVILMLTVGLVAFGWTSRRFERQADTFAVQHLSGMTRRGGAANPVTIEAAEAMSDALEVVARLNHIPKRRRSWRHGSIAWRQRHLHSLPGRPCGRLAIDRWIVAIKLGSVFALALCAYLNWRWR